MTPNQHLSSTLPIVRKRIERAHFLHEHWVVLKLEQAEVLADAGEELLEDLEVPERARKETKHGN